MKDEDKKPTNKSRSGIPMDEGSYKEWQKAFEDIEDCIKELYKDDKEKVDYLF